jgi:hypothetical protein
VETSLTLARQFRLVCLLYGALLATVSADEKHKQMPFSVELGEPFTFDGVPPQQAFAHAHADVDGTKWLFVTGRHNGLHGFSEPTPEDPENDLAVKQANQQFLGDRHREQKGLEVTIGSGEAFNDGSSARLELLALPGR